MLQKRVHCGPGEPPLLNQLLPGEPLSLKHLLPGDEPNDWLRLAEAGMREFFATVWEPTDIQNWVRVADGGNLVKLQRNVAGTRDALTFAASVKDAKVDAKIVLENYHAIADLLPHLPATDTQIVAALLRVDAGAHRAVNAVGAMTAQQQQAVLLVVKIHEESLRLAMGDEKLGRLELVLRSQQPGAGLAVLARTPGTALVPAASHAVVLRKPGGDPDAESIKSIRLLAAKFIADKDNGTDGLLALRRSLTNIDKLTELAKDGHWGDMSLSRPNKFNAGFALVISRAEHDGLAQKLANQRLLLLHQLHETADRLSPSNVELCNDIDRTIKETAQRIQDHFKQQLGGSTDKGHLAFLEEIDVDLRKLSHRITGFQPKRGIEVDSGGPGDVADSPTLALKKQTLLFLRAHPPRWADAQRLHKSEAALEIDRQIFTGAHYVQQLSEMLASAIKPRSSQLDDAARKQIELAENALGGIEGLYRDYVGITAHRKEGEQSAIAVENELATASDESRRVSDLAEKLLSLSNEIDDNSARMELSWLERLGGIFKDKPVTQSGLDKQADALHAQLLSLSQGLGEAQHELTAALRPARQESDEAMDKWHSTAQEFQRKFEARQGEIRESLQGLVSLLKERGLKPAWQDDFKKIDALLAGQEARRLSP